jgi:N-acetylneuraminic acid mutarotase
MFRPRIHRPRRAVGVAAAVMVAMIGLPAPAPAAAGVTTPKNAPSGAEPKTNAAQRVCEAPRKQGEMTCFTMTRTDVVGRLGLAPLVTPDGLGPTELRSAYALPSATAGAGQTVAIVDAFDNPNAEADLAVYRAQYGLPACTTANGCFRKVNQDGLPGPLPGPNAGWAAEISLDLDMASAVCPNCNLLLVEANSNFDTDLFPAVSTAADLGAKFISLSWGGNEFADQVNADASFNKPGVVITASSGDDGFGVIYPASSRYVTAVGGTSLVSAQNARGWSETAWNGAGSGCSAFEPKPTIQTDPDCARRTTADVSAVADPQTGVAVYNTYQDDGWNIFGGTSASAPIIAATYALAGTPAANTSPNEYPYGTPSALYDVVSGSNGSCGGSYLCTAQPGFDGPTGLGTPNGVLAFAPPGPHGVISGTVTDVDTGNPVVAAAVGAGSASALTDAAGHYALGLATGTYDVNASAFGYASVSTSGLVVTDGATTTANFALTAVPRATVSGLVRDGSGHGWPLYAKIAVDGLPGGPVFTDPATGRYQVSLPTNATYTLAVTALYPGYQPTTETVTLAGADVARDVAVTVDAASCNAPGYTVRVEGLQESFSTATTPAGWTVGNNTTGGGWAFTDDGNRGNLTGGADGFAIVDSDHFGVGNTQDTELRTPVLDFTDMPAPSIGFNSDFRAFSDSFGDLDLSLDGGQTWTSLQHNVASARGPRLIDIPIPQAVGKSAVQARWRYVGTFGWWWEVDNVFVGQRTCEPVHGGLVLGQTIDGNTQQGLDGTKVHSGERPADTAISAPTPDNPNLGDGFYWLFSSLTGSHSFTASHGGYLSPAKAVNVAVDWTTRVDFSLGAGKLTVTPAAVHKTLKLGNQATATVTVSNTGAAAAIVTVGEHDDGFAILAKLGTGAPLNLVPGSYSRQRLTRSNKALASTAAAKPYATPWTDIANFPTPVMDNAAAAGAGKVYSVGGTDGTTVFATGAAYDPLTGAWTPIAAMQTPRQRPVAAFVSGKLYVVGGWGSDGEPVPSLEIYDPVTNSWTSGASVPTAFAASGAAVLGDRIYVVGGCSANVCGNRDVRVYDPTANTWSQAADYPLATSWLACGGLLGQVYCAGGTNDDTDTKQGFGYNPATNAWSPIADLPIDLWAMGSITTADALLVSGGVTDNASTLTNQGFAYNPGNDTWIAIANSNNTVYRGASACGFYKIGGSTGGFNATAKSEVLPGFDQCGPAADVPWLSVSPTSFTLAPKATIKLTVTLDASTVSQPGDYAASLTFTTNTPYQVTPTPIVMTVTPPRTWGKITGTVTGASCSGAVPLAGAVVQIDTWATHYTLLTDANGNFALWLDRRNNPLTVIVAKDGWQPQTRTIKITAGQTTTANWNLAPIRTC